MSNSEPDLSFDHAWAKLQWAEHHISNLNTYCGSVVKEHPHTVVAETDPDGGSWRITVRPTTPIPPVISLYTGDAVHNMRAALDYCWMGLWRSINPNVNKKTLPRGLSRQEVEGTLKKAAIEQSLKGIDAFILDQLKPYKGGNDLLWLAGQLDNWNKHNLLITTLAVTQINDLAFSASSGRVKNIVFQNCQVIAGKPITLMGINLLPGEEVQFDREPDVAVDVVLSFREAINERPLVPLLVALLQETAEAVKMFKATFVEEPV